MSSTEPGLRRLVNGVLLPGFHGSAVPDWLAEELSAGLAGVVYFARNIESPEQVAALSADLHAAGDHALIAADEEGGDVTRLEAVVGSSYPGNAALGAVDSVDATREVARAIAGDLRRAGIDLDLAPTVDVNANPDNPVIGVRSFGADPALVSRHTAAFVSGLQEAGVAACAKHFPGHGDADTDSHLDLPIIRASLQTLRTRDLLPFVAAIETGVRAVLSAHVVFPALDEAPASLSPTLHHLLRDDLGFDGVVITDALDMRAVSGGVGLGGGAVRALASGADLLCLGNSRDDSAELAQVQHAILDALTDGSLTIDRLEQAHDRVGQLVTWLRTARTSSVPEPAPSLGRELARSALRVRGRVRLDQAPHVVDLRSHVNHAAGKYAVRLADLLGERDPATTSGEAGTGDSAERVTRIVGGAGDRRLVLVCDAPHRDTEQVALLRAVLVARPDTVVVCTGWPDKDAQLGEHVVHTLGAGRVNLAAAADALAP